MRISKIIISGCLCASFFIACHQAGNTVIKEAEKEYDLNETSELAALMRKMYQGNLEIRKQIEAGKIPENFPEEFKKIHSAEATPGMMHDENTFTALADQYLGNVEALTSAKTSEEAKAAYNQMVSTCASCHQVYCQGPLTMIRKMKIGE